MTNEQLVQMIQEGQDHGGKLRMSLWKQNQSTIRINAAKFAYSGQYDFDDLLQESYFGFDKAIKTYKQACGYAFSTHLKMHIYQHLADCLYKMDGIITQSRRINRRITAYRKYREEYVQVEGREPSEGEIMQALGISEYQYGNLKKALAQAIPIYGRTEEGDEYILTLCSEDDTEAAAVKAVADQELKKAIRASLDDLPQKERHTLILHHWGGMSCGEIGKAAGESRNTVKARLLKGQRHIKEKHGHELIYFLDDEYYYNQGIHGTGVSTFKNTGESATERTALRIIERENDIQNDKKDL